MHLAIFSSTDATGFAPEWTQESVVVLFGSARLDLTERPPAANATLNVSACLGRVTIVVPAGSHLAVHGFTLDGWRRFSMSSGSGPTFHIRATVLFASLEVIEVPLAGPLRQKAIDTRIFAQLADEVGIIPADVGIQPSS